MQDQIILYNVPNLIGVLSFIIIIENNQKETQPTI